MPGVKQASLLFLFILALFLPGKSYGQESKQVSWTEIFSGISIAKLKVNVDRPLSLFAAKVVLSQPSVRTLVTPSNGKQKLDVGARKTSEFLGEFSCQLAINGGVYTPRVVNRGEPADVLGLAISNGSAYSRATRYHALLLAKSGRAWIAKPPFKLKSVHNAVSGYYSLLQSGKNLGTDKARHPRAAVGISRNGRILYLLVIDGRQPGYSEGATLQETADWLKRLGAHDGLNLDGGGSATLVIEGPNGRPKVLNRPSDGVERRVANHLCIFAKRHEK